MLDTRRRVYQVYGVLGAAAAFAFASGEWQARSKLSRPYGGYTAAQMLDRSEAVCYALAPQTVNPSLAAEPLPSIHRDGALRRLWKVRCADEAGKETMLLLWDADDGQLIHFSCVPSSRPGGAMAILHRPEAVRATRQWLGCLEIAGKPRRWRLTHATELARKHWYVRWQAADRTAAFWLSGLTGELIMMNCSRPRATIKPAHRGGPAKESDTHAPVRLS